VLNISYFDLLRTRKYFDIFLKYSNSDYAKRGEKRERHYGDLIKRYYKIYPSGSSNSSVNSHHVENLINDYTHIHDVYESLRVEFGMGMRTAKLVSFEVFRKSIQDHSQVIVGLTGYRMDCIAPNAVPQSLLDDLKLLFYGLKVVPPKAKQGKPPEESPKLVAVSKTLHFLLPNLVMPVDGAYVLRFLGKRSVPQNIERQFALFKEVFCKYIELTAQLKLNPNNGGCNWWNISVPKRIDNAIFGFRAIFDDANRVRIICDHCDDINMLLSYLNIP